MVIINSWKRKSRSTRRLAKALKARRYSPGDTIPVGSLVINWGDSQCKLPNVLNPPAAIRLAANKLLAFETLSAKGVPVPRFASSREHVTWNTTTVVRHKLTGHSGEGIQIVDKGGELPDAPLYVEYKKKEQEFRIHVGFVRDEALIIAVQRKARRYDFNDSDVNWQVRNHANGFVFVRSTANPHPSCIQAAFDAVRAIGLDFGAVDILWNEKEGRAYVLEINTAPGLEGQTVEDYRHFFLRFA